MHVACQRTMHRRFTVGWWRMGGWIGGHNPCFGTCNRPTALCLCQRLRDPSHFLTSRLNGYNPEGGGLSITITSTEYSGLYTLHANCHDARATVRDVIYVFILSLSLKHTHLSVSFSKTWLDAVSISSSPRLLDSYLWITDADKETNNAASADKVRVPVHRSAVIGPPMVSTLCLTATDPTQG